MRKLGQSDSIDALSLEVFPVLQFCATKGPLFPGLKSLNFWPTTGDPLPFIPLFLSAALTTIDITFLKANSYRAKVAALATALPALCPNLQKIALRFLPRDSMVAVAVPGCFLPAVEKPYNTSM